MQDYVILLISALAGVALFGAVIYFYFRKKNPKKRKQQGREAKSGAGLRVARRFAGAHGYKFISPATLARNGAVAKLDGIVVGYFGVLGIKTLGYNGNIYGSASEEEWLQLGDNEERTYFPNPLLEAAADVRVIRDALFAAKMKQIPVEVVCVFTEPRVQLALPKKTGHYTLKTFKSLLQKDKYLADTGIDIEKVEGILRESILQE